MFYGADYNPEQWPESVWPEDARLMREAGVNLVTWASSPGRGSNQREGVFDFDWLDRVIDLLHAARRSRVDLATATASPPPWMSARYPESAGRRRRRRTLSGRAAGSTRAPASPVYRRLAAELVSGWPSATPSIPRW